MTPPNLDQLEELSMKATQKEWVLGTINDWPVELKLKQDDARFIFAMANAFPSILRELCASRRALKAYGEMDFPQRQHPADDDWRSKRDAITDSFKKDMEI